MCLNEHYSMVWVGKNLSDMFLIKNGLIRRDALSPWLFNFALEYAIKRVQINRDGLKLNDTHQLFVYADDVNILGGSVQTVKKNAGALVVASKETGLEVNSDKTKYMIMSRDQKAGQSHRVKTGNCSFERMENFKYLGKTLMNKILLRKELRGN